MIIKKFESFNEHKSADFTFQLFGSKSSLDYDVMVFTKLPDTKEEAKNLCHYYDDVLIKFFSENGMPSKKLNCNICEIENGIVTKVFKGMACEVNNSMFLTYDNFKQFFRNQISHLVDRDTDWKILRCYRIILSFLSRTKYRTSIKKALRGTLKDKINTLMEIDFSSDLEIGNKNTTDVDFYKSLGFQLAQTIGLIKGIEIYSKEEAYNNFPNLSGLIQRDVTSYDYNGLRDSINELIRLTPTYLYNKNEITYFN